MHRPRPAGAGSAGGGHDDEPGRPVALAQLVRLRRAYGERGDRHEIDLIVVGSEGWATGRAAAGRAGRFPGRPPAT